MLGGMSESPWAIYQCLALLGMEAGDCLSEMEANGIPPREALEAILEQPPPGSLTPGLDGARAGAALAQARPDLFGEIAAVLRPRGIHPASLLNWDGWDPDRALALLVEHWDGPGRPPLALLGLGSVAGSDLRLLPHGLRLQKLRLAGGRDLKWLPEGLELQGTLECRDLGLRGIPAALRCGGDLILEDLPHLEAWGEGIRIHGNLVVKGVPFRGLPPEELQVEGRRRVERPGGWAWWDRLRTPARPRAAVL